MESREEMRRELYTHHFLLRSDVVRVVETPVSYHLVTMLVTETENLSLHLKCSARLASPSPCLTSLEHRLQEEEWKPVEAFILTELLDKYFEPAKLSSHKSAKSRR